MGFVAAALSTAFVVSIARAIAKRRPDVGGGFYGQASDLAPFMPVLPRAIDLGDTLISIRNRLSLARQNRQRLIFRPRYTLDRHGQDAPLHVVLSHIDQIGEAIRGFEDVIYIYQLGYVGPWGEFHSSTHGLDDDPLAREAIATAALESFSGWVAVRRPAWHQELAAMGIPGIDRLTVFDDCIGCNEQDGGTWGAGEGEAMRAYMAALPGPVGGELSIMDNHLHTSPAATFEVARKMNLRYANIEWNAKVFSGWTPFQLEEFAGRMRRGWG